MSELRWLLDTNIVSYYLRRSSPVLEQRLGEALRSQTCAVSVLTRAELRYGQALMATDDRRRALVDAFLRQLPHLPWTGTAADHFGNLKAHLRVTGTPRGDIDTQIAAHALAEGLILVTHNVRHFEGTPGLQWVDWMAPG
ncbi:MAG: type II toxin-antitoxin system VapC family toxin [Burkholderiales bacterium]|nr:type II toxin-antitoxin system VapC family toxin [Burkholderiales bacterium]